MARPECMICLCYFSATKPTRQPYVSKCGHTMCYLCTTKIGGKCPKCRDVDFKGVKNYALIDVLETLKPKKTRRKKVETESSSSEGEEEGSMDDVENEGEQVNLEDEQDPANVPEQHRPREDCIFTLAYRNPWTIKEMFDDLIGAIENRMSEIIDGNGILKQAFDAYKGTVQTRDEWIRKANETHRAEIIPEIKRRFAIRLDQIMVTFRRELGDDHEYHRLSRELGVLRKERNTYVNYLQQRDGPCGRAVVHHVIPYFIPLLIPSQAVPQPFSDPLNADVLQQNLHEHNLVAFSQQTPMANAAAPAIATFDAEVQNDHQPAPPPAATVFDAGAQNGLHPPAPAPAATVFDAGVQHNLHQPMNQAQAIPNFIPAYDYLPLAWLPSDGQML